jgi:hypothetical protein
VDRLISVALPNGRTLFVGAASGVKEHRDGTDRDRKEWQIRSSVYKAYQRYLKAFNDGRTDVIDAVVSTLSRSSETVRRERFTHSLSETKAHVILRNARRLRQNGSVIETMSAFMRSRKGLTEHGRFLRFRLLRTLHSYQRQDR